MIEKISTYSLYSRLLRLGGEWEVVDVVLNELQVMTKFAA